MDNIGWSIATIGIIAIAFIIIVMGVVIIDGITSETMEPVETECIVNDKYVDTQDGWDKYRLIITDNEGLVKTITVTLEQYTAIEINDTIVVDKTATESIIFGTTYNYTVQD